ncbi:MAG: oligopeptide transporter, OPT family [Candidatus Marinimicrobia bacterium]|nr:oligopeptide transporter, OPT family [Candidatus Neomarinimicrobiota bacterium]MCF7828889.1 oligopeptide transporter, OPT family [Candidatus Neomarinimicrobiota bacterium]MCF7879849.1 oligopeptide transporter, OPT family [Candidatus Neomarinimicrobiota bacterium]
MAQDKQTVPDNVSLPEITLKAILLGIVLSIVLAGANAYLGLFAGMTVSASIPAAVLSMGILRLFRSSNILENNIVQTAASAGESLAAGVIFTLPALIVMRYWTTFDYLETTLIAGLGGVIGVLFTVPLRRALIVEEGLKFPEGIATAEVLRTGDKGGSSVKYIAQAGIIGALFKFGETGLRLWTGVVETATKVGSGIAYFGSNLSPALISVGYIVGINIAVLVFLGGAINWLVAIPIFAMFHEWPMVAGEPMAAVEWAGEIWSSHTRFLGVGAMVIGGLYALVNLRSSIVTGVKSSLDTYKLGATRSFSDIARTERDTPIKWVGILLLLSILPIFGVYFYVIQSAGPSILMAVVMLIAGFLFSAVAAYMAGLVGSSNNPISGVTIATILFSALMLVALLGTGDPKGPAAAIFIGAVVACAAAIGGDNMQDLKAGYLVGATPWKQQVMQMVGVLSAAVVLAPVLILIEKAYGIGVPTEAHPNPLAAPQATLMASVADGVFNQNLPWGMIGIGMAIAILVIVLDKIQEKRGAEFRLPVLAVAVGIYLPFELSVPIFLGGLVSWAVQRGLESRKSIATGDDLERLEQSGDAAKNRGLLFASGLITGEALIGILMAIPIVISSKADVLAIVPEPLGTWPGILLLAVVILWLAKVALPRQKDQNTA